jgi:hypothetical protein
LATFSRSWTAAISETCPQLRQVRVDREVIRAARNVIEAHGTGAEKFALARAKRATESSNDSMATTWRQIAEAVRRLQGHE